MHWTAVFFFITIFVRHISCLTTDESRAGRAEVAATGSLSAISSVLGALGFLKLKVMLTLVTAFVIVGIVGKVLGGLGTLTCEGLGIACPPAATGFSTSFNTYSQPDYTHHYDVSYRSQSDDSGFFNSIAKSLDVMDVSFRIFGIEEEVCKKKFVCMADNEALHNPLYDFAVKILGDNLTKYREYGPTKFKNCNLLYPECTKGLPNLLERKFDNRKLKTPQEEDSKNNLVTVNSNTSTKTL